MSVSFDYVQNIVAQSASTTTSIKNESGSEKVKIGEDKRKTLELAAEKAQEKIKELQEQLKEATDQGCGAKFGNWLTGSDGGVSDLSQQIQDMSAELKKSQQLTVVEQQKITTLLQELQGVQAELGERNQQFEKTNQENEQTAKID
jgi:ABC-type transporter Mla subunit MlaD